MLAAPGVMLVLVVIITLVGQQHALELAVLVVLAGVLAQVRAELQIRPVRAEVAEPGKQIQGAPATLLEAVAAELRAAAVVDALALIRALEFQDTPQILRAQVAAVVVVEWQDRPMLAGAALPAEVAEEWEMPEVLGTPGVPQTTQRKIVFQ